MPVNEPGPTQTAIRSRVGKPPSTCLHHALDHRRQRLGVALRHRERLDARASPAARCRRPRPSRGAGGVDAPVRASDL